MTKFYDDVNSFEPVRGCQFLKLYISMFEKWLESPQWLLAVSKPKMRMRVTSAWGQDILIFLLEMTDVVGKCFTTCHLSFKMFPRSVLNHLLAIKSVSKIVVLQ